MAQTPEAKRKPDVAEQSEVETVLASRIFARAPLLSRMLAYICEQSFQGHADALKEYSIGTIALGRGADFDPEKDSIVRVMATRLRKRLAEYYATEGAAHPVKIFLPEVGYAPLFVAEPPVDGLPGLSAGPEARSGRFASYVAVGLFSALLGGAAVWSALRLGQPDAGLSAAGANVQAIWSDLLKPDQATDIVVADSMFGLFQGLTGKSFSLTEYITRQYLAMPELSAPDSAYHDQLNQIITRRYTSMADVQVAIKVFALAQATRARVSVSFARDYSVAHMQPDNVILVGSVASNPWVATFNNVLNFRLEPHGIVRNLAPKPGEQSTYAVEQVPEGVSQGYAVAAFLPKNGGARSVLIAAGTETEGTLAAAEFLTSEAQLAAFRTKLPAKGRLRHFEVLLRTNKWSRGSEIVAFRVIS